jgi:hypothetical protein
MPLDSRQSRNNLRKLAIGHCFACLVRGVGCGKSRFFNVQTPGLRQPANQPFPRQSLATWALDRRRRGLANRSHCGDEVGLLKAFPLEQEWLAGVLGKCVGEAVAGIQTGWVTALSKIVKGLARKVRLLGSHWFDHDANTAKQRVALLEGFHRELALDNN